MILIILELCYQSSIALYTFHRAMPSCPSPSTGRGWHLLALFCMLVAAGAGPNVHQPPLLHTVLVTSNFVVWLFASFTELTHPTSGCEHLLHRVVSCALWLLVQLYPEVVASGDGQDFSAALDQWKLRCASAWLQGWNAVFANCLAYQSVPFWMAVGGLCFSAWAALPLPVKKCKGECDKEEEDSEQTSSGESQRARDRRMVQAPVRGHPQSFQAVQYELAPTHLARIPDRHPHHSHQYNIQHT
jgi:hypothetical protein